MISFTKTLFTHFFDSNTFQKGAALAYYSVFSIFPIIIIAISILGLVFGKQAVSGEIFMQLHNILGEEEANQIQSIIAAHHMNYNSTVTAIIGFFTLLFSASGIFGQIHSAFNSIWGIKAKSGKGMLSYLYKNGLSISLLMVMFFLIVLSTVISSYFLHLSTGTDNNFFISTIYEHLLTFLVITLLFSIMFKLLGDAKVYWKPAIFSGLFTAIFFIMGKIVIAMYLSRSNLSSSFGAASALVLIMLWVYYLSQIIFLGASFLKVLSDKMNLEILPKSNAVKIIQHEIRD